MSLIFLGMRSVHFVCVEGCFFEVEGGFLRMIFLFLDMMGFCFVIIGL